MSAGIVISDDHIGLGMKAIGQMSDLAIATKVLLAGRGEEAPAAVGVLMDRIEDLLGVIGCIFEGCGVSDRQRRVLGRVIEMEDGHG